MGSQALGSFCRIGRAGHCLVETEIDITVRTVSVV